MKITVYEECLLHKRSEQKAILIKSLKTRSVAHLACFEKFFCSAFGANPENQLIKELRIHYRECVAKKIEEVLRNTKIGGSSGNQNSSSTTSVDSSAPPSLKLHASSFNTNGNSVQLPSINASSTVRFQRRLLKSSKKEKKFCFVMI